MTKLPSSFRIENLSGIALHIRHQETEFTTAVFVIFDDLQWVADVHVTRVDLIRRPSSHGDTYVLHGTLHWQKEHVPVTVVYAEYQTCTGVRADIGPDTERYKGIMSVMERMMALYRESHPRNMNEDMFTLLEAAKVIYQAPPNEIVKAIERSREAVKKEG